MNFEDVKAFVRAMASGDGDEAKTCAALCAVLDEGAEKKEAKKASEGGDDDKKPEEKTEAKKASEGDDETEEKKESIAASTTVIGLAKQLHELKASIAEKEEKSERERLLASRPDFSAEVRSTLESAPLGVVKKACETWKRIGGGTGKDAQGAIMVQATRGEGQGDVNAGRGLPPAESLELKRKMGLATDDSYVKHEANASTFRPLPADAAQRILASKKGAVK